MSVPQCLIDHIGIEPCEGESSATRLLTDLPGLSIESLASTIPTEKWASARSAAETLIPIGVRRALTKLKALMAARSMNLRDTVDEGVFCFFGTKAQSGLIQGDQGIYIQKNRFFQPAILPIRVNWVALKSPNATSGIDINIKSEAGVVLWTYNVATIPADTEVQIPVDTDFYEEKIKVVVNGSEMQGYYADCTTGEGCCGELPYSSAQTQQRSAFMVNAIEGGVVGGWKSPGVKVSVETPCGDSIFCPYGERLADAMLYFTGVAFLKEWQASARLNVWSLKKDWVAERLIEWEQLGDEALHLQVDGLVEDMRDCLPRCFKVRQAIGFLPAHP